jgi:hypothetical protein
MSRKAAEQAFCDVRRQHTVIKILKSRGRLLLAGHVPRKDMTRYVYRVLIRKR